VGRAPEFGPEGIDGVMCDLDGVLYRGDEPVPGAAAAVARVRAKGVRFLFCTNNSRSTVAQYVEKLTRLGIPASADEMLTSAIVTAEVLESRGLAGMSVLVIGGEGIRNALGEAGIEVGDADPGAVVVGWDPEFTYDKMRAAASAVMNGATLIATNGDATFPAPGGLWPGAGSILASIETATGVRAEVMGKPNPPMMDVVAARLAGARRIAVIGDRPDSDLAGGAARGWETILVLTGVTRREDVGGVSPRPDYIADSIADLG
jgi:4-nitrophenyl phosphatase